MSRKSSFLCDRARQEFYYNHFFCKIILNLQFLEIFLTIFPNGMHGNIKNEVLQKVQKLHMWKKKKHSAWRKKTILAETHEQIS